MTSAHNDRGEEAESDERLTLPEQDSLLRLYYESVPPGEKECSSNLLETCLTPRGIRG